MMTDMDYGILIFLVWLLVIFIATSIMVMWVVKDYRGYLLFPISEKEKLQKEFEEIKKIDRMWEDYIVLDGKIVNRQEEFEKLTKDFLAKIGVSGYDVCFDNLYGGFSVKDLTEYEAVCLKVILEEYYDVYINKKPDETQFHINVRY